jgi:c-di-GMP phosphodiesterase
MVAAPNASGSPAPAAVDVHLARQPIFDRSLRVVAYELLFRGTSANRADVASPVEATAQLLLNAFVAVGLNDLVGNRKAFVNLPREFLIGTCPLPASPDQLVLEILEDVEIDKELIRGVAALREQGYVFALDDVIFDPRLEPLLELTQIVKMELPLAPRAEWGRHLEQFRRYPVQVLAEKVETEEDFDHCRSLGFDLFQGYFFCRPKMVVGQQLNTSQTAVLQLLSRLADPKVSIDSIEQIFKSDGSLSYKLLRYINSSKFGLRRNIESLRQAITLIGLTGVRTLAMLLVLGGLETRQIEVIATAVRRAMCCEQLARKLKTVDPGECFTAGLVSGLDAIFRVPVAELVNALSVSEAIRKAVLEHAGPVGEVVACARSHEQIDRPAAPCGTLSPHDVLSAFAESVAEADRLLESPQI